ncbi:MAG: PAS domain S-box protein [Deltaproteobacteria bacterium]|nr:PAS domain S-box protein [Deltaproteobacteria bacterium]
MSNLNDNGSGCDRGRTLRTKAEERATGMEALDPASLGPEETRRLLHELRVHQIELEMQNEELRRAQEDLETSRSRYVELYDFAPVGYVTLSEKGLVLESNLTAATLLGVNRGALIKQPITRFILSGDQDTYYRHRKALFETGDPEICEVRMLRTDSPPFWVEMEAAVARDAKGAPVCRCVLSDITERKRAEDALHRSEAKYRNIFDNAQAAIFRTRLSDGKVLECNDRFAQNYGYDSREECMAHYVMADHYVDQGSRERMLAQLEKSGEVNDFEARFFRKDGSIFFARFSARAYPEEGFLEGVGYDITREKDVIEELRVREEKYRTILESMEEGYYEVDIAGNFTFFNDSLCRMFGYAQDELMGMNYREYTAEENAEDVYKTFNRVFMTGVPAKGFDWEVIRKDGTRRSIEVSVSPRRDAEGAVAGFSGLVRDITERKRAEEEREKLQAQFIQAQKMESVGRLAGGVAHDFNNKLSVILGYAQMVMEGLDTDDPLYGNLQEILTAGRQSVDIVRQLLAFARKQTMAPKVLDLNETIEGMLKMLRRLIGEDIDLAWEPGRHLWPVKMDPSQIDQILANLCVNARDAISGVGKVTIETENVVLDESYCADHAGFVPGEYVMLGVSDNGIGMDKETLANAFEPFFTTKEVGKGTGLGLSTVYGIVKQNQGFVNIYSEPGKGTSFKIYLPRHFGEAEEGIETAQTETPRGRGETILVVEDETSVLHLARRVLEKLGYAVLTSASPAEAVAMVREYDGEIHLLMTDVVLPGMSGKDLAGEMMQIRPNIKTIFMSGYTADIIARQGVLEKGVHFMGKPFTPDSLARKVREARGS